MIKKSVLVFISTILLSALVVISAAGQFYTLYCGCGDDTLKTYTIFASTPKAAVIKANHSFKNFLSDQMGYKRTEMAEKQCGCGFIPEKKHIEFED